MAVKATGALHLLGVSAGSWKFRTGDGKFTTTRLELIETAKELVNTNPGGGTFLNVFVRGTAKDELGICFTYRHGPEDKDTENESWKDKYRDLFQRRHGAAFKGNDVDHTVAEIVLEKV